MKKLITWVHNLHPLKIITVFLAVTFLFLVQACNRPTIAGQPPQAAGQPPNVQRYDPTKDYPISQYKGGMNNFSDVDPRSREAQKLARDRADALIENAQRNIEHKGIDTTDQYVRNYREGRPFSERVKNLGKDVGSSATEVREGVTKGTRRGVENLQENVENAAKGLTKNVQRGTEDVGKNIQRRTEDLGEAVKRNLKGAD
jgi:predicted transcriptional regulator